jgi:membrane protein
MGKRASNIWPILRDSYESFFRHLGPLKAGSIAFFATLSLFPLVLLLVSVAGHAIGSEQAYREVAVLVQQYLPGAGDQVLAALRHARGAGGHLLVDLVGTFGLLWSAMNLFTTLSQVLTVVWFGEPKRGFLRRKLVSFAAVLAAGILFFGSMVLTSMLAALNSYAETVEAITSLHQHLRFLDSPAIWTAHTAVAAVMFFFLYWTMPAGRVSPKAAVVAAIPAALLWIASRSVFAALVTGSTRYGQLYGPLAGAVVLLLWIYYSAYIMIFCGEIGGTLQARYRPANGRG